MRAVIVTIAMLPLPTKLKQRCMSGRLVVIGLMFWGRLGAVTIMLILLKRRGHDTLLQYPEETVLVG